MKPNNDETKIASERASQQIGGEYLVAALRGQGYQPKDMQDAWGMIINVQVEIALDPEMGSKATTAAKFLVQMMGFEHGAQDDSEKIKTFSKQVFERLLQLIESEKTISLTDQE